jgi:hypothetical protein
MVRRGCVENNTAWNGALNPQFVDPGQVSVTSIAVNARGSLLGKRASFSSQSAALPVCAAPTSIAGQAYLANITGAATDLNTSSCSYSGLQNLAAKSASSSPLTDV